MNGLPAIAFVMNEGDKRWLVLPPEIAYGEKGAAVGLIAPATLLVFEVELIEVKDWTGRPIPDMSNRTENHDSLWAVVRLVRMFRQRESWHLSKLEWNFNYQHRSYRPGYPEAIDRTCKEQPAAYLRAVLSLVPKDFAMTVERDETPQHIEVRFVDNSEVSGRKCH